MKHFILPGLIALSSLLPGALQAAERPATYEFDVTVGGVKAEAKEGNASFAEVPKGAAAESTIAIDKEVPMLVVNAYQVAGDGKVDLDNKPTATLYADHAKEVRLTATMTHSPLKPGTYLALVWADGKTSRVAFRVDAKPSDTPVDFSKLAEFLRKKDEEQKEKAETK